jgi:Holliday junction resolvase RusA-like endonuclease
MPESIEFFVPGTAAPGGSKKAFVNPKTNRVVVLDDAKNNKGWRSTVALFGSQAMAGKDPLQGPLFVAFTFHQARPKGHFGSGKNAAVVKPSAPAFPTSKPDTTKLIRAAEDALKHICWYDDSQIVHQIGRKVYSERPGLRITIKRIEVESA